MEDTLKKRSRNEEETNGEQKSSYKNPHGGGGGGPVPPDISYPKQYRDHDPLLIERNTIIQEP